VEIKKIRFLQWQAPDLSAEIECSGGTYVRSVAYEAGRMLGCGAHLKSLRRLKAGFWSVEEAVSGSFLEKASADELLSKMIPPPFQGEGRWKTVNGKGTAFKNDSPSLPSPPEGEG